MGWSPTLRDAGWFVGRWVRRVCNPVALIFVTAFGLAAIASVRAWSLETSTPQQSCKCVESK